MSGSVDNDAEFDSSRKYEEASSSAPAERYAVDIQYFSRLSGELVVFLSELAEKVRSSAEQLRTIEQAVEFKKGELKKLHRIEADAVTLEHLLEEQRLEKERFESMMTDQRSAWEEEKNRREREFREYSENIKLQRQREEEEYRRRRSAEQLNARQELEEDLRKKQEAIEKNLFERELLLKEKELELMRLVQELGQFMSRLSSRV